MYWYTHLPFYSQFNRRKEAKYLVLSRSFVASTLLIKIWNKTPGSYINKLHIVPDWQMKRIKIASLKRNDNFQFWFILLLFFLSQNDDKSLSSEIIVPKLGSCHQRGNNLTSYAFFWIFFFLDLSSPFEVNITTLHVFF